ncbi:Hypothetical_protein [Hexamita inflata]|uniref:Hypothetical_protein n=1 Tax=Hexamita inflata TaxID=28002 RepID=A0AA86TCB3_9EUKA|nr:Hypothetical protein HINF_LOCUS137 [Hexamita inflata]
MRVWLTCSDSLNPPILAYILYTLFDSHKLIPLQFELLLRPQAKQPQSVFTNKCVQLILHVAWFRSGSATPTQVISADLELGSYATFVHGQQSKKKLFHQKLDVHATIKISMMYTNSEGFGKRVFQRQAFYNCTIRNCNY